MFCIKCGTEIEDDSQFCKKCGVSVYRKTGGVCSKCGIEIEDDSVFCRNCGASVQQKEEVDYTQIYPYVTKIHAGEKQNTRVIHMIGSSSTGIGSNIEKIVGLIGGIMMIMSGYMDYISINYIGRYNFRLCERSEDWKILVGLVIASIIAVFVDASFFLVMGSLATIAAAGLSVVEIVLLDETMRGADISSSLISYENGFYFLMIGTVLLIIGYVAHAGKVIRK